MTKLKGELLWVQQTHQRITHSLQRLEYSLLRQSTSENNKERLGVPKDEVSKNIYDEFGLECGESIVIDQPKNEEHEVDISIKILEQAKRINLEACDGEHTSMKEDDMIHGINPMVTRIPYDSHEKKIQCLKEGLQAMKGRTKILRDTILQQDIELKILGDMSAKLAAKLSSLEEQLDSLMR